MLDQKIPGDRDPWLAASPGPEQGSATEPNGPGLGQNECLAIGPGNTSKSNIGHGIDKDKGVAVDLEKNNMDAIQGGMRWVIAGQSV